MSYSSHKGVISAFGQHFAKTGELDPNFHRLLIAAFEKRQLGDYLSETSFALAEVEELMAQAQNFLAAAREWLSKQELSS